MDPLAILALAVAALLLVFRLSLSTKGAKKVRRRGMSARDEAGGRQSVVDDD